MKARRIARELALLSISQLPAKPERLQKQQLQDIVLAAVRTLTTEAHDILETAAAELQRADAQLLSSETRAADVESARERVAEAVRLAQNAINRLSQAMETPEFVQLANQADVRHYALEIVEQFNTHRQKIDDLLTKALVDWQLSRLAWVDRDILRIAVIEVVYLGIPEQVAINESIELAKRYSEEASHRFINGVLRRVTDQLKAEPKP